MTGAVESLVRLLLSPAHTEQGIELARSLGRPVPFLEALKLANHAQHEPLMVAALQHCPEVIAESILACADPGWLCRYLRPEPLRRAALRRLMCSPRSIEEGVYRWLARMPGRSEIVRDVLATGAHRIEPGLLDEDRLLGCLDSAQRRHAIEQNPHRPEVGRAILWSDEWREPEDRILQPGDLIPLLDRETDPETRQLIVRFLIESEEEGAREAAQRFLFSLESSTPGLFEDLWFLQKHTRPPQRQALNQCLIERTLSEPDPLRKRCFAVLLCAPLPELSLEDLLPTLDEASARALIAGLGRSGERWVLPVVEPLADGALQDATCAEAAEALGFLWSEHPPAAAPATRSVGLTMARAMAGQHDHYARLLALAEGCPEAALALHRVHACGVFSEERLARHLLGDVLAGPTDAHTRRAQEATCPVRDRWLSELPARRVVVVFDHTLARFDALDPGLSSRVRPLLRKRSVRLVDCLGRHPGMLLSLFEVRAPWSETSRRVRWHLESADDGRIADALREQPYRVRAMDALPKTIGPETTRALVALLERPAWSEDARTVLFKKNPPDEGTPVPLSMLLNAASAPLGLRLVLGQRGLDPLETGWRAELLCGMAQRAEPACLEALSRSRGWLLPFLQLPEPPAGLLQQSPGAVVLLSRHLDNPRARRAIVQLVHRFGEHLTGILPHAWKVSGGDARLAGVLASGRCGVDPGVLLAALQSGKRSDIERVWRVSTR